MSANLRALQQRMAQAVLDPRAPRPADILGDARAGADERLDVYRHGYRLRLAEALRVEFPGLARLAGEAAFARLLAAYVEAHPSGHYNIRWHGDGLPAFLERAPPWRRRPALAAMARLDWALSTAFDAADEPALARAELAAVPGDAWPALRLELQQALQVLPLAHNLEAIRRAADLGEAPPRLRRRRAERALLAWRQAHAVHYRLLDADEAVALAAAMRGEPFAQLCERLATLHAPASAAPRMVALLQAWLDGGLIRGWRIADG
ncbi:DNA-binding domain-containing protein [Frateuria defendens]|uniref:HvfC/BufC N-terminal domain-containing protein n=1 Tax=Frateuria defendens TaxID=2219559 RepID=UPI00066FB4A7|nr:DNA-binding domain-containing protein [Frateuria defendens]